MIIKNVLTYVLKLEKFFLESLQCSKDIWALSKLNLRSLERCWVVAALTLLPNVNN
jgi:hypothetical protein